MGLAQRYAEEKEEFEFQRKGKMKNEEVFSRQIRDPRFFLIPPSALPFISVFFVAFCVLFASELQSLRS